MSTREAVQPAVISKKSSAFSDEVSPASSAIVGITVLASAEDVMAVLRSAVLFAGSLRTPLLVDIIGEAVDCADLLSSDRASSRVLNSIEKRLRAIYSAHAPAFVLEATMTAASFVTAGTISVRVHRADSNREGKRR